MDTFIEDIVVGIILWPLSAWLIMLELGAAHSYNGGVPAPGFWTVFWLVAVLSSVAYVFGRGVQQAFRD